MSNTPTQVLKREFEERLFHLSVRDTWSEEQEDVDPAAGEDPVVRTLLEEMSSLEADHEQFEVATKLLRENLHAGEEQ